ncbi:mucin-5AC [Lucilia cuprina]|uniref:mucin-5AC n=1 Tax=Lucilia cuprina TaxID=7375 RepID=UPI001F0590FC|nr:mucin-5AC [Lucilia cuprina]
MDLMNISTYIWNIFLLFLFFLPGAILESFEKNNTKTLIKNLQLDLKDINSMETINKMSSTAPSVFSTALALTATTETPVKAILLSSLTKTTQTMTAAKAATTQTTTESIKLLSSEQKTQNDTSQQQQKENNHYKQPKKTKRNLKVTTGSNHEILKSNMTTIATSPTATLIDEQRKQEQQTKLFAISATDFPKNKTDYILPTILHDSINTLRNNDKTRAIRENTSQLQQAGKIMLTKLHITKKSIQNSLVRNPFENVYKDQNALGQPTITNISSISELYIDDPDIYEDKSDSMLHRNNYDGIGQKTNTLNTETITINSINKSNQAAVILAITTTTTTTRKPSTLATKQNHMYDNNSALSYLPYQSAALKASAPNMKTLNSNLNMYPGSGSSISRGSFGGGSSSSLKRDTLMSLAGIISTTKAAAVDNSFMKNSTNSHILHTTDDVEKENVLKIQHNFKSNNSLAMKQISQTTMKITPPTTTTIALNKTLSSSSTSSSALPFNVSSTHSVTSAAIISTTKEIPTTTVTTSTSKSTLRTTTRRRKIPTTTLKPPPTIDDYQTITSQAGTHAYLPCNVKQLVKKPISWLRVRDGHILTVDQTTFIADQRFQSIFTTNPERWSLQIKYVQLKDAGIYECQVSTEPKASAIIYLHVVEPKTELIGAPTRHVKAGSQVKLLCIISQALEPPLFINWFYNQKQIYLHNRKGWHTEIERIELPPETTTTTTTTTSTTTTTTTTAAPTTTTSTSVPSLSSSSSTLSSTSSSMLNGSETSAMHVFTSITPQQSLNDGNLLELVSESTYNNYPNLIQPEATSISTTLKTQQTHTSAAATTNNTTVTKTKATPSETESMVAATTSTTTTTLPSAMPVTTTTLSFDDDTDDNDGNVVDDDDEVDYKTNPSATAFEAAEAIAAGRGYMMLSSLMTFTDVKQITTASLIIPSVQKQDSGNYTCSPSNSEPRTVILHVLNGEYSASAITSAALNILIPYKLLIFNLSLFIYNNSMWKNTIIYTQYLIKRYSGG